MKLLVERMKSIKHILVFYYVAMGGVIFSFAFFTTFDASMDKTIISLIMLYIFLFPLVMLYTLRYALHIFLFSLAFISGFYGFYHYSVDEHSVSNALYFTFRLYLLDFADVFTPDGSSPNQYPYLLEIARWSAASYTISTIFIAMYRSLEKKISLFLAQTFGNHHVIFHYNEKSHCLIQDLRNNQERVIVVDEKFSSETENMLEEMNVLIIQSDMTDENAFRASGVKKAVSVSLFHEKDKDSLYLLMKLEEYAKKQKSQLSLQKALVHIEENRYKDELISFLRNVEHFSFAVEVINVYEEIARKFWKRHDSIIKENNKAHLLVVGYGALGKQMVSEASKAKHHSGLQHPFAITVLDSSPKASWTAHIEKLSFDIEKESLKTFIEKQQETFTHIFICLDEDYMDLMEGIELSEFLPLTPIYMNFTDESIEQTLTIATTETKRPLYSIGMIQDVLTQEYLGLQINQDDNV